MHVYICAEVNYLTIFSFLATNELIEHADCVLPIDNQALYDIVSRVEATYKKSKEAPLKSGAPIQSKLYIILL